MTDLSRALRLARLFGGRTPRQTGGAAKALQLARRNYQYGGDVDLGNTGDYTSPNIEPYLGDRGGSQTFAAYGPPAAFDERYDAMPTRGEVFNYGPPRPLDLSGNLPPHQAGAIFPPTPSMPENAGHLIEARPPLNYPTRGGEILNYHPDVAGVAPTSFTQRTRPRRRSSPRHDRRCLMGT
jgi:hypothetical protein